MRLIEWNGETKTKADWAKHFGLSSQNFDKRYKRFKGNMDRIANTPVQKQNAYTLNGKRITLEEIAKLNGTVSDKTIGKWMREEHITVEEAIQRRNRKTRHSLSGKKKKPEFCCEPDCENCPYPDCKWS